MSLRFLLTLIGLMLGAMYGTVGNAVPVSPTFTVLDTAHLFTPSEVDALTKRIAELRVNYDQKVIVYTVPYGLTAPLSEYASKLKTYWGVQRVFVVEAPEPDLKIGRIGDSDSADAIPYLVASTVVMDATDASLSQKLRYREDFSDILLFISVFTMTITLLIIAGCIVFEIVCGRRRRYR